MLRFSTTVTTQRVGDWTHLSSPNRTTPCPASPLWSRSSFRFDIGRSGSAAPILDRSSRTFAWHHRWSRYAIQLRDEPHDISEPLINDSCAAPSGGDWKTQRAQNKCDQCHNNHDAGGCEPSKGKAVAPTARWNVA